MTANKRLREDLEDKEADYQKLLSISKDILKEKKNHPEAAQTHEGSE